jgi:hypothetical protein
MNPTPIYDDTAEITCTAAQGEVSVRIEQLERMRSEVRRIERTPHGLLLHFDVRSETEADLHRFAIDEKGCCQFWGFAVETGDGDLTLRWDGPPAVEEFMDRLFSWFQSDAPLSAESGLL